MTFAYLSIILFLLLYSYFLYRKESRLKLLLDNERLKLKNKLFHTEELETLFQEEKLRAEKEKRRILNEKARVESEKIRAEQEHQRIYDENLRIENEKQRTEQEKLRLEREKQYIESENKKIKQEQIISLEQISNLKKLVEKEHIVLKNKSKIHLQHLIYVKSEGHYLELYTKNKKELVRGRMTDLITELPPNFQRSHRSYIVNKNYLYYIKNNIIFLETGAEIPLSRKYKHNF